MILIKANNNNVFSQISIWQIKSKMVAKTEFSPFLAKPEKIYFHGVISCVSLL